MSPDNPFNFTNRDDVIIYKLGSIEATLKELRDAQLAHNTQDQIFHTAADTRLKSLESSRSKAIGGVAAISAVSTVAVNFLYRWVSTLHG